MKIKKKLISIVLYNELNYKYSEFNDNYINSGSNYYIKSKKEKFTQWAMSLPYSFIENFTLHTREETKKIMIEFER